MAENKEIIIYTDGSALGNPGPGGYAAILRYGDKEKELFQGYRYTTNNRMEILAAAVALESIKGENKNIRLFTDSRLIVDAVNKNWIKSWKKKGWRKADKKPVLNQDLWQRFDIAYQKHDVKIDWIAAHTGIEENERCDELAKAAAESPEKLIDKVYELEHPAPKPEIELHYKYAKKEDQKKISNQGNNELEICVINKRNQKHIQISSSIYKSKKVDFSLEALDDLITKLQIIKNEVYN